jgi:diguanylate cyclase (GGDEF)-like protein
MEKAATPQRTAARRDDQRLLSVWEEAQGELCARTGLALLLVEGRQPPQLTACNNNTICQTFQSSPAHSHLCEPYCGEAHQRARAAGGRTDYRCHAGLNCFAIAFEPRKGRSLAVIGGRAFLSAADYRALAERFRTGDLRELLSDDLFRNVLFTTRDGLDQLSAGVAEAARRLSSGLAATKKGAARDGESPASGATAEGAAVEASGDTAGVAFDESAGDAPGDPLAEEERLAAASYFGPGTSLEQACRQVLDELTAEHDIDSAALMLRRDEGFTAVCATGKFRQMAPEVSLRPAAGGPAQQRNGAGRSTLAAPNSASQLEPSFLPVAGGTELFPLAVADEIKGALLVGEAALDEATRERVREFCRRVAMPLELLRLREELERRMRVAYHLQALTEQINSDDPDDPYAAILRHSTELLRSERASLLLFDERAGELLVKAAVGPRAEAAADSRIALDEGVAGRVLREGRPLVVRDLVASGHAPAPPERDYKTASFISYPLTIGGRRVGVLNVTDKAGGGQYDDVDLNLLDMLAPQMALALDRAEWHQKATQFQLLSITDALTGLLNRRYLEERLSEELERSKRHRFAMSFLMLDIDNFKAYNDRHGHQAGDVALQLTAQSLKSALRSEDVAARYGGEEFSVLLPQTSAQEALVIAERIRRRVESTPFPHASGRVGGIITVSVGISSFGPGLETPESVVRAADQALYRAKSRGRNRLESYAPPATSPNPDVD